MKSLNDIKEYVQAITQTIERFIEAEVTIVDINDIVVAIAIEYNSKIGAKVKSKSVFT